LQGAAGPAGPAGAPGVAGAQGPVGPTLLTEAYDTNFGSSHPTNIKIDGWKVLPPVQPGATLSVTFDFSQDQFPGCPDCIDQIQVGFIEQNPVGCVYNGIPNPSPAVGSASFTVTAPMTPGTYVLAAHRSLEFSCLPGWELAPGPGEYIGIVSVQ